MVFFSFNGSPIEMDSSSDIREMSRAFAYQLALSFVVSSARRAVGRSRPANLEPTRIASSMSASGGRDDRETLGGRDVLVVAT